MGIGDAFAALIAKRFGKHKIKFRLADNKKSFESSIIVAIYLLWCGIQTIYEASKKKQDLKKDNVRHYPFIFFI